jgi:hypothetical protein
VRAAETAVGAVGFGVVAGGAEALQVGGVGGKVGAGASGKDKVRQPLPSRRDEQPEEDRAEAADILRSLIDPIALTPNGSGEAGDRPAWGSRWNPEPCRELQVGRNELKHSNERSVDLVQG